MTKKTCISLTVKVVKIVSKYTTELRYICEVEAGLTESKGYNDVNSIIQKAIPKIFSFDFPIFDESYRNVLETKILKHYYTQEIGLETYGLWKLKLDTKLNEIMPYYNQLYESTTLEFNPLYDVNYSETNNLSKNESGNTLKTSSKNIKNDSAKENTLNRNTNNQNDVAERTSSEYDTAYNDTFTRKYSDTPQGTINDVNYDNNAYLTNLTYEYKEGRTDEAGIGYRDTSTTDNGTESTTSNETYNNTANETGNENTNNKLESTESYIKKVEGKSGGKSSSELLTEYRATMLNIDMMVIEELSCLFMQLW